MTKQPIDLAQFRKGATEAPGAHDSAKTPVKTALLLIQDEDGSWTATPDLAVVNKIEPQSVPDGQSMIAGLSIMISDIQAEKTANMTLAMMNQMAQAQMQAAATAQIAAGLHLPKG